MRNLLLVFLLLAVLVSIGGCGSLKTPLQPPGGFVYTRYKAPLSLDFDGTVLGSKTGSSSTRYFMIPFIYASFAWDEADVAHALMDAQYRGGITEVTHANYEYLNVLGIYAQFKVEAHGM